MYAIEVYNNYLQMFKDIIIDLFCMLLYKSTLLTMS